MLDGNGSTDIYPEAEARQVAAATGGHLVKITTLRIQPEQSSTTNEDENLA